MKYLFNGVSLQNGRQSNMDSLLLKAGEIGGKDAFFAVVCDGVGSLSGGAYASGVAARMLGEWFEKAETIDRLGLNMRDAILEINSFVITSSKEKKIDTASTLSALLLVEENYYIVHVGDSRVYCFENGMLSVLTNDDVSKSGKLSAYIGKADNILLQYSEGVATDKTFLICSDGLYKRMDIEFIMTKMKTWNKRLRKETIKSLAQFVVERGETDNISFALVKIED